MSQLGCAAALAVMALGATPPQLTPEAPWPVRVSADGRYLVTAAGRPFFWLGDTAWLAAERWDRADIDLYLRTRADQGFTVVQIPAYTNWSYNPNRYGALPFAGRDAGVPAVTPGSDPSVPGQYDWWDHVDYIVGTAEAYGLTVAFLPAFVGFEYDGTQILNRSNACAYGAFVGERYGRRPNVVWVLGGDDEPDTPAEMAVWNEMARCITLAVAGVEDYSRTLITYHPRGVAPFRSSHFFHDAPWLDFNMIQTWGAAIDEIPAIIAEDRALVPPRPTGIGEGAYDEGLHYPELGPMTPHVVRKQAYWSYLSGGYYVYGNVHVYEADRYPQANKSWQEGLRAAAAPQMTVLRDALAAREWWTIVPDPSLIVSGTGSGRDRNVAARLSGDTAALVYVSTSRMLWLDLGKLRSAWLSVTWINPATGETIRMGVFRNGGVQRFNVPSGWEDALLALDPRRL